MLKLNEEIEVNIEAEQRDNLQTKIRELEEELFQEDGKMVTARKGLEGIRSDFILSCVFLVMSLGMFVYLAGNVAPFVVLFFNMPVAAIAILGVMVGFVAQTYRLCVKHIPMFIYCEKAKRGKYTKDNYYSQFMRHSKRVKELEQELEELKRTLSSI